MKNTIKFIKEHLAIVAAIASFFIYPHVIRLIDPTAATYDAGVLQIIVISIIMLTVFQWCAWRIINALWPDLAYFAKHTFTENFKSLTAWQKQKSFYVVYFSLLAALVMLSRVIS